MTESFRGLITEIVSPAAGNGEFDREGLRRLLDRAAGNSSAVFVNSVSGGEALDLPVETKREIMREAMDALQGRVVLFAGVTGRSSGETVSNIEFIDNETAAKKFPGEVFLVDAPLCYRGNRGLSAHYARLAGITRLPFILFNDPLASAGAGSHFRRHNIRTNVLKKLSANDSIKGVAHNGGLNRSLNYARAVRRREGFPVLDADEMNFLDSPGSGGVVSIGANILPGQWKQVVESSFGKDEKEKRDENYMLELIRKRENLKELHRAYRSEPAGLVKTVLKDMDLIASDRVYGAGASAGEEKKQRILALARELL